MHRTTREPWLSPPFCVARLPGNHTERGPLCRISNPPEPVIGTERKLSSTTHSVLRFPTRRSTRLRGSSLLTHHAAALSWPSQRISSPTLSQLGMTSVQKTASGAGPSSGRNPAALAQEYQSRRQELQGLAQKMGELEADADEHL